MKRRDFIRHLEKHGYVLDREGGRRSIYRNPPNYCCIAFSGATNYSDARPTPQK